MAASTWCAFANGGPDDEPAGFVVEEVIHLVDFEVVDVATSEAYAHCGRSGNRYVRSSQQPGPDSRCPDCLAAAEDGSFEAAEDGTATKVGAPPGDAQRVPTPVAAPRDASSPDGAPKAGARAGVSEVVDTAVTKTRRWLAQRRGPSGAAGHHR